MPHVRNNNAIVRHKGQYRTWCQPSGRARCTNTNISVQVALLSCCGASEVRRTESGHRGGTGNSRVSVAAAPNAIAARGSVERFATLLPLYAVKANM